MIVPKYWAEAKLQKKHDGKQVTLKRFGWSDLSVNDAQTKADERVNEAFVKLEAGEKVRKIDHKVPYNGAEGLPIREEVISHHDETVITRNSYGALCINTPDVLFADVDFESEPGFRFSFIVFLIILLLSIGAGLYAKSLFVGVVAIICLLLFTSPLADYFYKISLKRKGGIDNIALTPIHEFSQSNPGWNLRVYKTPLGIVF